MAVSEAFGARIAACSLCASLTASGEAGPIARGAVVEGSGSAPSNCVFPLRETGATSHLDGTATHLGVERSPRRPDTPGYPVWRPPCSSVRWASD